MALFGLMILQPPALRDSRAGSKDNDDAGRFAPKQVGPPRRRVGCISAFRLVEPAESQAEPSLLHPGACRGRVSRRERKRPRKRHGSAHELHDRGGAAGWRKDRHRLGVGALRCRASERNGGRTRARPPRTAQERDRPRGGAHALSRNLHRAGCLLGWARADRGCDPRARTRNRARPAGCLRAVGEEQHRCLGTCSGPALPGIAVGRA